MCISLLVSGLAIWSVGEGVFCASGTEPTPGTYDRLSIACGSSTVWFAGRVVYRSNHGELLPVRRARFTLSTHGTVHCHHEPEMVPVRQHRNGKFTYPVELWSDLIFYYKGDTKLSARAVDDTGTMLIQADGCEDLTVHFDDTWSEHDLEMKCPGRD